MSNSRAEVIVKHLREQGTRRIKLGIADIDGVLRGKYLTLDKLAAVVESGGGFCDCIFGWDIDDQLYDNAAFSNWNKGFPDVAYRLDLDTIRALPYEENTPYFIADLVPPEGEAFHPVCPRGALKRVLAALEDAGFRAALGFEYEFFVFDETPQSLREKGFRDPVPFTCGNYGYSVVQTSVHSDLHEEFIEFCEAMDMDLEGYHTETGPGVLEAALAYRPALEGADRATLFKTFTKVFFQRQGLLPTFMAKWSPKYPGQSGHLHISLTHTGGTSGDGADADAADGASAFWDGDRRANMSPTMDAFVAGAVAHMRELCALAAPTINSYTRLIKGAWAPTAAAWGIDNRTTALRVIPGSPSSQRLELRLGGADGNPYLVAAAVLAAGLEGIQLGLTPDAPIAGNAYEVQDDLPAARQLPRTLREAAAALAASDVARRHLGDAFVDHFAATRDWECRAFERAITDWELARYFELI